MTTKFEELRKRMAVRTWEEGDFIVEEEVIGPLTMQELDESASLSLPPGIILYKEGPARSYDRVIWPARTPYQMVNADL